MKLSIALPVLNGIPYVHRAVESVIAQTFKDWELIIYDNGSTDGTADYLAKLDDPRITVIRDEVTTRPAIDAWHYAMGRCRNDYILMLGHDDWYDPDFMSRALTHITENKLDVYSGWMRAYDDNLQFTDVITSSSFINRLKDNGGGEGLTVINGKDFIDGFSKDISNGFSKMHLSTTFIRRTLYQQCGGFNTSLRYCAEAELYLKLAALGAKFGFLNATTGVHYIWKAPTVERITKNNDKFHDFYAITDYLRTDGLIDQDTYQQMMEVIVTDLSLSGRGLNPISALMFVLSSGIDRKFLWTFIVVCGSLLTTIGDIAFAIQRRLFGSSPSL